MTPLPPDPPLVERFRADVLALSGDRPPLPLGVAVSGGGDSLALLLLAHAAFPQSVRAISIDHGLRPAAAVECGFVARVCAGLGVAHETVTVRVEPGRVGIQAAAREARRHAFGRWGRAHRLAAIATGHHADDQAETILMRLARGAGVGGLSGIGPTALLPAGEDDAPATPDLIRPLLGWTRAELAALVRAAGLTSIDDPSNRDERYDRARFRRLLAESGLFDARRLAATASHCHDADAALDDAARDRWHAAMEERGGTLSLSVEALRPWRREMMRRILLLTFSHLGVDPPPRGAQIIRLLGLLESGRTATLAGIKAVPKDGRWIFTPAPPHRLH